MEVDGVMTLRDVGIRTRKTVATAVKRTLFPPDPVDEQLEALITIGRHSYPRRPDVLHWDYSTRLVVGAFCSMAECLFVLGGNHRTDWITTFPIRGQFGLPGAWHDGHPATKGDIVVGNDVWIGHRAMIMSGARLGDGVAVGAGAVVAGKVPAYAIVAGNPARVVRYRFAPAQIEALQRIRWWEWSDQQIEDRVADLCDADVDRFIARFDPGAEIGQGNH